MEKIFMATNKEIRNIAIVGTGVIGASWAALYLAHGFNVTATDPAPNAEANLRQYIDAAWKDLTAIGLSPNASRDQLQFTPDMKKALSDADLVQENGPERQEFKIKLFADMADATPQDSIIASSSSGLTMSVMQSACQHPERCVTGHPFNPPHVIPLVEVVAGTKTSSQTVEQAIAFYASIGKKPIHVRKEVVGQDRKSTRLNSSHMSISYAVFCLKKKTTRLNSSHMSISYAGFCLTKKEHNLC